MRWQLGMAAAAALAGPASAQTPADGATWYGIFAEDGSKIGHASRETLDRPDGRDIIESSEIIVREGDTPSIRISQRSVVRTGAGGRPVEVAESSQTGLSWVRIEARIGPDSARIVRRTRAGQRSLIVPLPAGVRFDNGGALLRGWNPSATPRLEFDSFNISAMAVEHVVIEAVQGTPRDAEGRVAALRKRYEGEALSGVARLLLDEEGRIVAVTQPMLGTTITMRPTDRETALKAHTPFQMLRSLRIKSPFRIPASAAHIRYRFGFPGDVRFDLPETGEQRISEAAGETVVDICAACGPGLAHDSAALADALKSTAWLQSDDPRIRAIAAPVARLAVADARKMELLLERARPYLKRIDFVGHYSAAETIDRRAGDCTEAAVLLAALGRAAGIPTRVANGLVYSRQEYHGVSNAFMPHSWTLAWVDGTWRSFDLALDAFDSTHIAITVGDGDARSIQAATQLGGLLQWQAMTEVRSRPGT